jgi:hypothetical protein
MKIPATDLDSTLLPNGVREADSKTETCSANSQKDRVYLLCMWLDAILPRSPIEPTSTNCHSRPVNVFRQPAKWRTFNPDKNGSEGAAQDVSY